MAALAAFLLLTGTLGGIVAIILCTWVLGLVITQVVAYLIVKRRLDELDSIMNRLDQKYLFAECVELPKSYYERKLFTLMRRSGKSMIEEVSNQRESRQEYREYIESWVHEMKAPITAAGLIANSTEQEIRRKLATELANIENHVERALYYARAESAETDFFIRQTSLHEIVSGAVEKHRTLLIQSGVRVETDDLDHMVYTDGKWAIFIIGQILQNAVRYRSEEPVIQFYTKTLGEQTQLVVQDNGIGIPHHELPRIFERGFTGSNGRQRGGSTGMGLYIAHKLADHMLMELRAVSKSGEGTAITMTFQTKANLTKV
jgi:signal transduction histidine kinase